MTRSILVLLAAAVVFTVNASAAPRERFFLRDGERVVFLGDSITYAGMYVQYVDAYLRTRFPDRKYDLINLGLPSEGVTGLSEPDHPFPRPNVHERLERALTKTRPDVVVACYGMNDGMYYPFARERFRQYQQGIRRLVQQSQAAGARVVLMTPPPFDAAPVRAKTLPITARRFSWMTPYAEYDDVLEQYSRWLLTLRGEGLTVVDLHRPITEHLTAARRTNPRYALAGDGVHMDSAGHLLIARQLLRAWGAPLDGDTARRDARRTQAGGGQRIERRTYLPLPVEQAGEGIVGRRLIVTGLRGQQYDLFEEGQRLGGVTGDDLRQGVDLLRFPQLSLHQRAADLLKLIRDRERLMSPAWLTHVGHQRPDTPAGRPLQETQRETARMDAEIQRLAAPVTLRLELRPVEKAR